MTTSFWKAAYFGKVVWAPTAGPWITAWIVPSIMASLDFVAMVAVAIIALLLVALAIAPLAALAQEPPGAVSKPAIIHGSTLDIGRDATPKAPLPVRSR
jgi:hypothetical protein